MIMITAMTRLIVVTLAAFGLAACGGSAAQPSNTSAPTTSRPATTTTSVSHDFGSKDASADVTIGKLTTDPTLNIPEVSVTVTNHSSKRSNYIIEVSLESADGKAQLDTTAATVENLEPGQSSKQTAEFAGMIDKPVPASARVVLKSVDRLAT